jgi:hypothetical protein
MHPLRWSLCWALLLLPASALAQEEQEDEVEQRLQSFLYSDPAYLQQPQEFQVALGALWSGGEEDGNFSLPLSLEFGASERFEFEGEVELAFPRPGTGSLRTVDRAEASVKMELWDEARRGLALSAGLGFVGSRDTLDSTFDPGGVPQLTGLALLGPVLANVELSVDLIARNEALDAVPTAALGLALDLGKVQPVFEAAYENDEAPAGTFALGLRVTPVEALELGLSVPLRVSEGNTDVGVAGQLVWSLGGS